MAMYYQGGSEIQPDGLHTLYLMNPNYPGGYGDHPTNMLLLNSVGSASSSHALNSIPVPLAPLPQQVMSIPLSHHEPQVHSQAQNTIHRFGYNSWAGAGSVDDQEGGNRNQPNMGQQTPQGLSLSLSTNQTGFNKPINSSTTPDHHHHQQHHPHQDSSPKIWSSPSVQSVVMSTSGAGNSTSMQSVILGSKYLKAAQELLDEVANVGKSIKDDDQPSPGSKDKGKVVKDQPNTGDETEPAASNGIELTTAQRQEIQMKKAKLISMLDEVEQRYRQYNVQMQIIVASFEQAAGLGSAKSYTQLALKTISKQFRCLKDAISTQIKGLSKSLGEEEKIEGSKLKYVDNQLRQHRALQQLGMVQNNAWRPQRGLPERAVSVLRAWLFEHFLHPYPKDSDKQMLAKQTGLTRSQVSNWFINARVRLWKPMVEEMYVEEMKNQQQSNTSEDNNTTKTRPDHQLNDNNSKMPNKVPSPTHISSSNPTGGPGLNQLITPLNMENHSERSSKKPRNNTDQDDSPNSILSVEMEMKNNRGSTNGYGTTTYNEFQELSRFNPGQLAFHGNYNNAAQNNVSLTLGLPPSGISAPGTHHQQNFLNFGTTIEAESMDQHDRVHNGSLHVASHSNIGYDQMLSFQNRKPFPAQLLPDFVA